jgi:hypothetical protein
MYHDRVEGNAVFATHMSISKMLNVRRQSVIKILRRFEEEGAISDNSGQITILDQARLQTVAGDSYGVSEAEHARVLPPGAFQHPKKGSKNARAASRVRARRFL